jgi:hypothetical protein
MPSELLSSITGSGGGLSFAPDLTAPSSALSQNLPYRSITGINGSSGLTTAISLTGKYAVSWLKFEGLTSETITIKLTVDGVIIWNDTFTCQTSLQLLGNTSSSEVCVDGPYICNQSLLLEIQTATDTSVNLEYLARPIL